MAKYGFVLMKVEAGEAALSNKLAMRCFRTAAPRGTSGAEIYMLPCLLGGL
jgi:hypothetical protein